jgi:hypothetical protein
MSRPARQTLPAASVYTLPPQKPVKPRRSRKPAAVPLYLRLWKRLQALWLQGCRITRHESLQKRLRTALRPLTAAGGQWLHWLQEKRQAQLASKRLRLCETLSLGEKRFVAIVQVDGQQFLVGGAAGTVSMLGQLSAESRFTNVLQESGSWQRTQE